MTARSIRRAQERKARKEMERKAQNVALRAEELSTVSAPAAAPESARLAANRANAQLSTGPTSPEGKAKVSLNAVKTALTGRTVLLPGDDAADYERHIQNFADDYRPIGPREADLVQSIADTWWRLKRIPCLESALLAQGYVELSDSFEEYDPSVRPSMITAHAFLKYEKQIRNLQLQEARLFRRYEKDRAELRQLQAERQRQALETVPPAENGFEFSSDPITMPLEPSQAIDFVPPTLPQPQTDALDDLKTHSQAA